MAKRTTTSFKKLDVAKLLALRAEIQTALIGRIAAEKKALTARINQLSSLQKRWTNDGTGIAPIATAERGTRKSSAKAKTRKNPLKGTKAAPKYRGPNGETWAGRGLAPRWLTALEKKGKKRDAFLIKP
jgi:DNA-binding protein H-NS